MYNFYDSLAPEGVDVHVVCPGSTSTNMILGFERSWEKGVSTAEEVAEGSI
jgi:short-subunit dehydrogenase